MIGVPCDGLPVTDGPVPCERRRLPGCGARSESAGSGHARPL